MRIVTLALSGGIDSTAALLKLFKSYNFDKITAHHVGLLTREGADRVQAELRACRNIIKWFGTHGMPVEYSESQLDLLFDRRSGTPDIVLVQPQVTQAMLHYSTGTLYTGMYIAYGDHLDEFRKSSFRGRWDLVERLFRNTMKTVTEGWYEVPAYDVIAPNYNSTKRENYEYLPEDLLALTTSCRKGTGCGNCAPCLEIEGIRMRYHGENYTV